MMPGATAVAPAIGRKPMIPSDPWTNRAGGHGGFAVRTLGSAGRVLLTAFLTGEIRHKKWANSSHSVIRKLKWKQ
jgi:hypothetical protein